MNSLKRNVFLSGEVSKSAIRLFGAFRLNPPPRTAKLNVGHTLGVFEISPDLNWSASHEITSVGIKSHNSQEEEVTTLLVVHAADPISHSNDIS
jgi:hypothetical protein